VFSFSTVVVVREELARGAHETHQGGWRRDVKNVAVNPA
jgi:hypothetical protein